EDELSRVESRAAPVYRDILAGHLPEPNQQRADFAVFLAYLLLRTPAVRRDVGELIGRHLQIMQYAYGINDKAFEGLLRRHGSEDGEELDPEVKAKVREWMLDPTHYTLQMSKEQTLMALSP